MAGSMDLRGVGWVGLPASRKKGLEAERKKTQTISKGITTGTNSIVSKATIVSNDHHNDPSFNNDLDNCESQMGALPL